MCVFKTYKEHIMGIILYFFHIYSIFALPTPPPTRKFLFSTVLTSKAIFVRYFVANTRGEAGVEWIFSYSAAPRTLSTSYEMNFRAGIWYLVEPFNMRYLRGLSGSRVFS